MTTEWREVTFEELLSIPIRNGIHKSEQLRGRGQPIVKMGELFRSDYISGDVSDRVVMSDRELSAATLAVGDLLFARRSYVLEGSGKCSLVVDVPETTTFESSLIRARPDASLALPRYLMYFFASPEGRSRMASIATQTAVSGIRGSDLARLPVLVPPLGVQAKIVAALTVYDKLIENNLRRTEILEEMAEAIYREWFVSLRGPGYDGREGWESRLSSLPGGWERRNLFEVASVTYGFGFKSKYFHSGPRGRRIVRIRDIPRNTSATYTNESADEKYLVSDGDILVGMDGEFHMCMWRDGEISLNQRVARFRPMDEDIPHLWLFFALRGHIRKLNSVIAGTTVAHLGDRHLRVLELVVPPKDLLIQAGRFLEPIERLARTLHRQTQNLRVARHLLIPKLISGQVDTSRIEIDTRWSTA